jgi:hypothetical protein
MSDDTLTFRQYLIGCAVQAAAVRQGNPKAIARDAVAIADEVLARLAEEQKKGASATKPPPPPPPVPPKRPSSDPPASELDSSGSNLSADENAPGL